MEKCKTFFSVIMILICLPILLTIFFQGSGVFFGENENESEKAREILIGILAKEVSADTNIEALKAQAVIVRTSYCKAETEDKEQAAAYTTGELKHIWGEAKYEENLMRFQEAVEETQGMVMISDDQLIDAAYHAVSAGKTRTASELYPNEKMPYLKSVDGSMDIPSPDYLTVTWYESGAFQKILQSFDKESTADIFFAQESMVKRDSADYVTEVMIGKQKITGEEFRQAYALPSACFELSQVDGRIRITTKGLGHGLGLSQYGANVLAQEGYSVIEILEYYYQDVNISEGYCSY